MYARDNIQILHGGQSAIANCIYDYIFKGTILTGIFPRVSVAIWRLVFGIYNRIFGEIEAQRNTCRSQTNHSFAICIQATYSSGQDLSNEMSESVVTSCPMTSGVIA